MASIRGDNMSEAQEKFIYDTYSASDSLQGNPVDILIAAETMLERSGFATIDEWREYEDRLNAEYLAKRARKQAKLLQKRMSRDYKEREHWKEVRRQERMSRINERHMHASKDPSMFSLGARIKH